MLREYVNVDVFQTPNTHLHPTLHKISLNVWKE